MEHYYLFEGTTYCSYCKKALKGQSKNTSKQHSAGHRSKCLSYKRYKEKILESNKDKIINLYVNLSWSLPELSAILENISYREIQTFLQKNNIYLRSIKDTANSDRSKNKRKNTSYLKTGFEHNFCKEHPSRQKWQKRLLEEEGITNVFQRDSVKEKSIQTLLTKYQTEKPWLTPNSTLARGPRTYSKLHQEVVNFLLQEQIPISIEFKIPTKFKKRKGYYSVDISIENTKKLIDVYGDYWHGNPKIFKSDDIILRGTSGEIYVEEKWEQDSQRNKEIVSQGYELYLLWENNWKNDPTEKEKLLTFILGDTFNENSQDKIYSKAK